METLLTNDSFTAYTTDSGILIQEKKSSAKKFGTIIMIAGIVFIGISFLPLENLTADWIVNIFKAVFWWGGISMAVMGSILFIVKGIMAGEASSTIDNNKQELTLRGKVIPFSEIREISILSQEVMNRKMTFMMVDHNGKKKSLVAGAIISKDDNALAEFAKGLDALVKGERE